MFEALDINSRFNEDCKQIEVASHKANIDFVLLAHHSSRMIAVSAFILYLHNIIIIRLEIIAVHEMRVSSLIREALAASNCTNLDNCSKSANTWTISSS